MPEIETKDVRQFYIYDYNLEEKDRETDGLETWTVSDKDFTIEDGTFAKEVNSYQNKNNVLHIKPAYDTDNYPDFVMTYDLNSYKGQTIKIEMSMDVWLNKDARVAWQINSNPDPFYPAVCGVVEPNTEHPDPLSGPAMSANTWHSISGQYTYTVPNTPDTNNNGKKLYLSAMQIEGAEAYFANAAITITVQ